jgi:hypothetical protein
MKGSRILSFGLQRRRGNTEDSSLHTRRRENLKFHKNIVGQLKMQG